METEPYNNARMPQSCFGMVVLKVKEKLNFISIQFLSSHLRFFSATVLDHLYLLFCDVDFCPPWLKLLQ